MPRKIEELSTEQITALSLFSQLIYSRFGKTKKAKYEEIAKRMKLSINTIKSWIYKYHKDYELYLKEIINKKDVKRYTLEGLTKLQSEYVRLRLNGYGKEEAKQKAGYSENTKADTIEKTKGVFLTMAKLREKLISDTVLGAEVVLNSLVDVAKRAKEGVNITEYVDESNPDGRLIRKTVKQSKSFSAEIGAIKEINNMLGYEYGLEVKSQPIGSNQIDEQVIVLADEDLE